MLLTRILFFAINSSSASILAASTGAFKPLTRALSIPSTRLSSFSDACITASAEPKCRSSFLAYMSPMPSAAVNASKLLNASLIGAVHSFTGEVFPASNITKITSEYHFHSTFGTQAAPQALNTLYAHALFHVESAIMHLLHYALYL